LLYESVPAGVRDFSVLAASRPALELIQPHVQWAQEVLSSGVKSFGREADHSSPANVKVNNSRAIPPLGINGFLDFDYRPVF
jgi:hypothetical protein